MQILSCWLSMDKMWRAWCLRSIKVVCVSCVLMWAVVVRYNPWVHRSNLGHYLCGISIHRGL